MAAARKRQAKRAVRRVADAMDVVRDLAKLRPLCAAQDGTLFCFFCGAHEPPKIGTHDPQCVWLRAHTLIASRG